MRDSGGMESVGARGSGGVGSEGVREEGAAVIKSSSSPPRVHHRPLPGTPQAYPSGVPQAFPSGVPEYPLASALAASLLSFVQSGRLNFAPLPSRCCIDDISECEERVGKWRESVMDAGRRVRQVSEGGDRGVCERERGE